MSGFSLNNFSCLVIAPLEDTLENIGGADVGAYFNILTLPCKVDGFFLESYKIIKKKCLWTIDIRD